MADGSAAVAGWLAMTVLLIGCGAPLGTNDVELDYTGSGGVSQVRARLAASHIAAEVRATTGGLAIQLDAELVDPAEQVLGWRGGLAVERVSPPGPLAVARDPDAHADGTTVVVRDPVALVSLAREAPATIVVLTYGKLHLWQGRLGDILQHDALVVPRGDAITAYQRARSLARLLASPDIPDLALARRTALDADWPLAIACLTLPMLVGLAWIFFIRRLDRARPEPWWLLLATFALGGVSQLGAGWLERLLRQASPYLDLHAVGFDLSASHLPLALIVCVITIGIVEEGAKLIAAWALAMHRREFDEPVDGIVFAAVAAIGFATVENIKYFTHYRFGDGIDAVRSLECVSGHLMYAALWGYALGQRLVARRAPVVRYFLLAALLHGMWDTAIEFDVPHAGPALTLIAVVLFVIVLRKALRWGTIDPAHPAEARAERRRFPVGRRGGFALSILAMYGFGYQLVDLGLRADRAGYRVSAELVAWSAIYGSLFVIAAWGVATLMPLDVVVDEAGVTFGGALRSWPQIRGVTRAEPWTLVLDGDSELRLGPGSQATIDRLEAAVRERLSAG